MKKDFVNLKGSKLEIRWIGEPVKKSEPVIVFLHEGLGCVDLWRDFPASLYKTLKIPSLLYSRQGYGRSSPSKVPKSLDFMHKEALEILPKLLDTLEIERAVLFGHSDGASISLINCGGLQDKRIKGLVLLAPHVFVEDISISSIQKAKLEFEKGKLREKLMKYHFSNVDCAFWGWAGAWLDEDFLKWNIEEYLASINIPVLLIQGEDDQYGTLAQVTAIKNGIGINCTSEIISGCAHSPHLEKPEATLNLVKEFIKGLKF